MGRRHQQKTESSFQYDGWAWRLCFLWSGRSWCFRISILSSTCSDPGKSRWWWRDVKGRDQKKYPWSDPEAYHKGRYLSFHQLQHASGRAGWYFWWYRPLRQPSYPCRRWVITEPVPYRFIPYGACCKRAYDNPGRRWYHTTVPDQHQACYSCCKGILRKFPAVPVHGSEQPSVRAYT